MGTPIGAFKAALDAAFQTSMTKSWTHLELCCIMGGSKHAISPASTRCDNARNGLACWVDPCPECHIDLLYRPVLDFALTNNREQGIVHYVAKPVPTELPSTQRRCWHA